MKECTIINIFDTRGEMINHFSKDFKDQVLWFDQDNEKYYVYYKTECYEYQKHNISVFKYIGEG